MLPSPCPFKLYAKCLNSLGCLCSLHVQFFCVLCYTLLSSRQSARPFLTSTMIKVSNLSILAASHSRREYRLPQAIFTSQLPSSSSVLPSSLLSNAAISFELNLKIGDLFPSKNATRAPDAASEDSARKLIT